MGREEGACAGEGEGGGDDTAETEWLDLLVDMCKGVYESAIGWLTVCVCTQDDTEGWTYCIAQENILSTRCLHKHDIYIIDVLIYSEVPLYIETHYLWW